MDVPFRHLEFSPTHTCTLVSKARAPVRDDLDGKPLERKANISEADTAVLHNNIPSTHRWGAVFDQIKFIHSFNGDEVKEHT